MSKLFVTGFPGFIGSRLLRELFRKDEKLEVIALVQQKFLHTAETVRGRLYDEIPSIASRLQFVFGDITLDNLGIEDKTLPVDEITAIFHLAAAYDLAIPRSKGMLINVEGTRNVLDFAKKCGSLSRFDYVSTAYVSGTCRGAFSETDFNLGQRFKNFYEETKFLAEKLVRDAKEIPSVIYRPGIVVGDSTTGETVKYDGPYYALQAMSTLRNHFPFPKIGSGKTKVNLVPIDFVVSAMATLFSDEESIGRTFHLTDPSPLSVMELQRLFADGLGKRFTSYPLTPGMARAAMKLGVVRSIYRMPPPLIDYFSHDVRYESASTTAFLQRHKISCPKFTEYWPNLLKFYVTHKEEELQGILI